MAKGLGKILFDFQFTPWIAPKILKLGQSLYNKGKKMEKFDVIEEIFQTQTINN